MCYPGEAAHGLVDLIAGHARAAPDVRIWSEPAGEGMDLATTAPLPRRERRRRDPVPPGE